MSVCRASRVMFLSIILIGLCDSTAYSANKHPSSKQNNSDLFLTPLSSMFDSYYVTFNAGAAWKSGSHSQVLPLTPTIERTYAADRKTRLFQSGEISFGVQHTLSDRLRGQFGLAAALSSDTKFSGEIWEDNDPLFNNYKYSYEVQHAHVALKAKIMADLGYQFLPWISGSFGVGINKSHDYLNMPVLFQAVEQPGFSTRITPAYTYTLGAGIQHELSKNWQIGFGYEFADWGRTQLGLTHGQTTQNYLTLPHLYTHNLLLNLSYLA